MNEQTKLVEKVKNYFEYCIILLNRNFNEVTVILRINIQISKLSTFGINRLFDI